MSVIFTVQNNEGVLRIVLCSLAFVLVFCSNYFMHWNNVFKTANAAWVWFISVVLGLSITLVVFIHINIDLAGMTDIIDFTDFRPDSMAVKLIEIISTIVLFFCNFVFVWIGIPQWEKLTTGK